MARITGLEARHARSCRSRQGGRCNCSPSYRAQVWLKREGRTVRKTFPTRDQALEWRQQALVAARRGALRAPSPRKLREVASEWQEGARTGRITNRSGDPYKPSAIRAYESTMRLHVLPELGDARFSEIRITDLQAIVDGLRANDFSASTIESTVNGVRALYRRAMARGEVSVNPTVGLELPAIRSATRRFATASQAEALIEAVPARDRAIWATAFYAGLRRGELMGLRREDVDLAAGLIHVRRGWDTMAGEIAPKSTQGRRKVPIPAVLRDYLDEAVMDLEPGDLVMSRRTRTRPFCSSRLMQRARKGWAAAGIEGLTLHEARHTFASLMVAAGVNAKALATFMGHHSIVITLDLYGHLMPGSEEEAAALLDDYLLSSREKARAAGQTRDSRTLPTAVLSGSQR